MTDEWRRLLTDFLLVVNSVQALVWIYGLCKKAKEKLHKPASEDTRKK